LKALLESRYAAPLAALSAGALTVAGFAPLSLSPLPFLTLAVLIALLRRSSSPLHGMALGFAFGAGLFGAGMSWVYISLHDFGEMPAPLAALATFLYCSILALYPAIASGCLVRLSPARAWGPLIAMPVLWTLFEWIRGWLFTGVPWLALGYSQVDSPLSGLAPVLGVYGVSFATVLCAGLLYTAVVRKGKARAGCLAGLALVLGLGQLFKAIPWTQPEGKPIRVSLLQGDVPQELKFRPDRYERTLATYKQLIEDSHGRLVILPETAIPRFLDTVDPDYLREIARIATEHGADVLLGVPIREDGRYYNSVVSLGVSPTQRYDKSHLVPFGEFVPRPFAWMVKTLAIPLSDFSRGPAHPKPLSLANELVAPNICWEDAFGEDIIRQLPQATLLVNVSNVAWFGDSLAPAQHLQISRMRAIETGRYMLRATNTGVTAIVDARGRVVAKLPEFTQGALEGDAQGYSGASPYVRFGNLPVVALCLGILIAFYFYRRRLVGRAVESR
jgi:apolipoprotein N-acyltransferase